MFGLMELSRQRLRSSLIDKSFEKCNYCKGSGLILNATSISEQIIKVIKEKLSNNSNSTINVKCNTVLAENLLNIKKNEIIQLETIYSSKISFYFNSQYSLHDPIIEIEENKSNNNEEISRNKKGIKKEKNTKKKTIVKKTRITKSAKKVLIKNNSDIKNKENTEKLEPGTNEQTNEKVEEKTGWWS
tara:strand:- start:189 stop:749 length:561 start_codon:yes stop_codon:yes gene_type:complete